ncbi:hypothetical protein [Rhodococcus tukisamuensis]|uniref:IPT/TIG domain-containing protein n=1 Tax=Rhodococcus tukisamuensis TaxID=168276 RepID=A0A1G6RFG4_9NOCA|nr:hypothetical protein [Rhodococcus tukisamuensis]SDD03392.1 hypothetical protein SAMN05444580_102453 [Rhodococcus tukisamuensis]
MRTFNKAAIAAVAATIAWTLPVGVAGAFTTPFGDIDTGSLGSVGSSAPEPEGPGTEDPVPAVTLSKSTDLTAAGDTVTVSGTGFSGAGAGLYVGLIQDSKYSATDSTAWMTTQWLKPADITAGAWTATIDVAAVVNGSDCLVNTCSIYTVAAHGSADRTQDTKTPVTFKAPVVVPAGPAVTLSKATDVAPAGETITVSGTGFSGAAPGLYVGLVQDSKYSATDAGAWMTTAFIRPTQIVGGAWTATVDAAAVLNGSDCLVNTCSIYTVAAHGSADRTQDTKTPVSFAAPAATAASEFRTVAGKSLPVAPALAWL